MSNKVYEAINNISNDLLTGIEKTAKNQHQGFMFRGIDAVYNALAPALVEHKLVILPRMTERTVEERKNARGGALFYVTVKAEFDFVSSEDGSKHTVTTYGEAMDSGDKATNKAMSIAYKYAAFQTFCIPTEDTTNDPDSETHEVMSREAQEAMSREELENRKKVLLQRAKKCRSSAELTNLWLAISNDEKELIRGEFADLGRSLKEKESANQEG